MHGSFILMTNPLFQCKVETAIIVKHAFKSLLQGNLRQSTKGKLRNRTLTARCSAKISPVYVSKGNSVWFR